MQLVYCRCFHVSDVEKENVAVEDEVVTTEDMLVDLASEHEHRVTFEYCVEEML